MSAPRAALVLALAGVSLGLTPNAHAHAPLARGVAVARDGNSVAVAVPGFGLITRSRPEQPFVYVCDALLGLLPNDTPASVVYLDDGTLLMGSVGGVRRLTADSCPAAAPVATLSEALVVALAVHASNSQVVYAVAAGIRAGVWRSDDGGLSWTLRGPISGAERVSALHVDALDPNTLTLSRTTPGGRSTMLRSSDGGATFSSVEHARALTLLHVPAVSTRPLWAVAPALDQVGIRGFELLRADTLAGPWLAKQRVNYFGGFVIDAQGVLWLGDEGGGLYRSADAGESFVNVSPDVPVACLTAASDALWACTPGTNTEPTLMRRVDGSESLLPVIAFSGVTSLVDCNPAFDVPMRCGAAWVEWQRDVLMRNVDGELDAGLMPGDITDAGIANSPLADAATAADGASANGATDASESAGSNRQDGGCALPTPGRSHAWWLPSLLVTLVLRRRRSTRT